LAELPLGTARGRIDLLLDSDHVDSLVARKLRLGKEYEPVAARTRLGWLVRSSLQEFIQKKDPGFEKGQSSGEGSGGAGFGSLLKTMGITKPDMTFTKRGLFSLIAGVFDR